MTSGRWAVSGGFPEPTALSPSCSKGLGCGLALLPTGSRPPARDRAHFHVRLPVTEGLRCQGGAGGTVAITHD